MGNNERTLIQRNLFLRLATINVGGWSDDRALRLRQIIDLYNLDALLVTETRRNLDCLIPGIGRPLQCRGIGGKRTGVCIVKPVGKKVIITEMQERWMHIEHPAGISIIGAYGPIELTKHEEKRKFWSDLDELLKKIPSGKTIILMGDFNAGNEESRHPSAFEGTPNFTWLVELAERHHLELQDHTPTWISPVAASKGNSAPSRTLDRCLVRHEGTLAIQIDVNFDLRPADHGVLAARIHFLDIPRDHNRPHNKKLSFIDEMWRDTKKALWIKEDTSTLLDTVNLFWKAKKRYEYQQREKLQIIDETKRMLTTEKGVMKIREYLYGLWGKDEGNWEDLLKLDDHRSIPFNENEITSAIQGLKNNVALGADRTSPESLKRNANAVGLYKRCLDIIWDLQQIPTLWKRMRVKPIPKATTPAEPSATRPITCLSTSMKVLNSIIIKRWRLNYERKLNKSQHAYREQHSTTTAVAELIHQITSRKKLTTAFLDMSKAYDSVTKRAISEALDKWELPSREHNLIVHQYIDCEVQVELNGYITKPFMLEKGIRQGCALSCMIFALIMAQVHQEYENKTQNTGGAAIISYSDDIVIYGENTQQITTEMNLLSDILSEYGLKLNKEKTKIFEFDLEIPYTTEHITWLGIELTRNLTWDIYTTARLSDMNKASTIIQNILAKTRIDLKQKDATLIVQGLLGPYMNIPTFMKTNQEQQQRLQNELVRVLSKYSKLDYEKAQKQATKMQTTDRNKDRKAIMACAHCGGSFRNNAGLAQHLIFCNKNPTPSSSRKEKCPTCQAEFHVRALQQHRTHCRVNQQI